MTTVRFPRLPHRSPGPQISGTPKDVTRPPGVAPGSPALPAEPQISGPQIHPTPDTEPVSTPAPEPEPALEPSQSFGTRPDLAWTRGARAPTPPPAKTAGVRPTALALALVATALLSACGGEKEDDGPNAPPAPVGSVVVEWSFARQDGVPTTCEEVGADRVFAFVGGRRSDDARALAPDGGTPPPVFCGEEQREIWTQLTEASLPVFMEVLTNTGEVLAEHTESVRVVPQMRVTVEHTFGISGTGPSTGDLRLDWTIDGEDPAVSCANVGAETVFISTRSGSVADFDATVPCTDGSILFEGLRIGGYIVRAELIDADGERITLDQLEPNVPAGDVGRDTFRFNIASLERARIHSVWTINGRPPETECAAESVTEVEVRYQRFDLEDLDWFTVESATAACELGHLDIEDLIVLGRPRLEFALFDDILGDRVIITSTTTEPFELEPGVTSTISADFDLTDG